MRDSNLYFNSNVTISAAGKSAIVDLGKTGEKGVWVKIWHTGVVGGAPQSGAEITAQVEYSDSSTFAGVSDLGPTIVRNQNTANFRRAVLCQTRRRYARVSYTVGGTTPSFTGIYAAVVTGPERDDVSGTNTY